MANAYGDGKYGVITRKWFGLTKKWGGDMANGSTYTFGTTDATTQSHLAKHYLKGPCKVVKFGCMVLATLSNSSNTKHLAKLYMRGASASLIGTFSMKSAAAALAPGVFASIQINDSTGDLKRCNQRAGDYIAIKTATPTGNTATTSGSVAFFVDVVPTYDQAKWDSDAG